MHKMLLKSRVDVYIVNMAQPYQGPQYFRSMAKPSLVRLSRAAMPSSGLSVNAGHCANAINCSFLIGAPSAGAQPTQAHLLCTCMSVCGKNWYRSQTLEFDLKERRAKQIYISIMDGIFRVLALA